LIKKLAILFLLATAPLCAQGYRFDSQVSQEFSTTLITGATNVLTVPAGPIIAFCNFPANAVPCTNKATTYTSVTLGTSCPTSTQITLTGSNTCVASPDSQDNWGVWVPSGQYSYTITIGGVNFGPYVVNFGVPSGTLLTNLFVTSLNGTVYADQEAGATADVKINACITAAIASGAHICNATGLYGTQTIAAQINVGDSSQDQVALILPPYGTWGVTITNGTSCAIKQYGNSTISGLATGGSNKLLIQPSSGSTSVSAYYCQDTSPTGGGSYISADGFEIYNPAVAAATSGSAMKIFANFDNANYGPHLIVADYMEIGIQVVGACCSANFWGVESSGGFGAGAQPLSVNTNAGANSGLQVNFFGGSFDHPGTGKNNILVQGTGTTAPITIAFHGTYMEGYNGASASTAMLELQSVQNATITGLTACALSSGSTQPAIQIDDSPAVASSINITGLAEPTNSPCLGSTKGIVDNINSVSIVPDAANNISSYHTGNSNFNGIGLSAPIKNTAGTATMGLTLKTGSGAGNYTGANTAAFASVDTTNLCTTITVPTGWKLKVDASAVIESATAAVAQSFALVDAGVTCTSGGVTALTGTERDITPPALGAFDVNLHTQYIFTGDGAAHSFSLVAKTANAADSWGIQNTSATSAPSMTFTLMPSN
jgi:hypothetical protein